MYNADPDISICLIVPTEKLRDKNWKEEFTKWGHDEIYSKIDRYCYASISKVKKQYDLIGADEIHNITPNNSVFFENNKNCFVVGMTATPPEEEDKLLLLNKYCPVVSTYTLQEAVEDGIVLPFRIKVVELSLDNKLKYVEAGSKEKKFLTTETEYYKYLSGLLMKARYSKNKKLEQFRTFQRMRFLYSLKSKTEVARKLIENQLRDKKTMIFCGSIKQAEELCENNFHSKTNSVALDRFIKGEINHISCVRALNEGINIPMLDAALIVQGSSKKREIIQRIGRTIRWREGASADIYILSTIDTQDSVWTENAIAEFPKETIEYIHFKNI